MLGLAKAVVGVGDVDYVLLTGENSVRFELDDGNVVLRVTGGDERAKKRNLLFQLLNAGIFFLANLAFKHSEKGARPVTTPGSVSVRRAVLLVSGS